MTKVWVSVPRDKHRELSLGVSEKELQLNLAKVKRSQGLSVTLLKLESDSGSGNNLQLVVNSLKSLDLPQMEIEPFDGSPEHFTSFLILTSLVKWQVTNRGSRTSSIIDNEYIRTPYDNVHSFPRKALPPW